MSTSKTYSAMVVLGIAALWTPVHASDYKTSSLDFTMAASSVTRISTTDIPLASTACKVTLREASVTVTPKVAVGATPPANVNTVASSISVQSVAIGIFYGGGKSSGGEIHLPVAAPFSTSSQIPISEPISAAVIGTHTFSIADVSGATDIGLQTRLTLRNSSTKKVPVTLRMDVLSDCQ